MISNVFLAVDFNYVLIEFYKYLALNEHDVAVVLMIEHFIKQKNVLITADLLSIKMNLTVNEIDKILVKLINKGYLLYDKSKNGLVTSLEPLKNKLNELYKAEIDKEFNKKLDENMFKTAKNIYEIFEKELGRTLSPIEFSFIDEWVANGVTEEECIEALKIIIDQKNTTFISLKMVDKYLLQKQIRHDLETEGHTSISSDWNKDINYTINVAKKKMNS